MIRLKMRRHPLTAALAAIAVAALLVAARASAEMEPAAQDPGPRQGPAASGGPLPGLGQAELDFFAAAKSQFNTVDSVSGALNGETGVGLGPRFNSNFCGSCHAFPAAGGSSPPVNPQIAVATLDGAHNTIPSFVKLNGPVREARFVHNLDGSPDGTVHAIFTITGRSDAPGCTAAQEDIDAQMQRGNVALRIPTNLFGLGLVESVPDRNLEAADAAHQAAKQPLGIRGHFNISSNDSTITRFGWKAQDKSLLMFSGEAYNVEQGVTNELFPSERAEKPNCQFNALPEDATALVNGFNTNSPGSDFSSGTVNFAGFTRLLAPPTPATPTTVTRAGQALFGKIGCEACHFASQTTSQQSLYTGQGNLTFHPFSDFEVHRMGIGLADHVVQGNAGGDEFRTAPLWGIGQRLFFLHDGRAKDLVTAIKEHDSAGSEASATIGRFRALTPSEKQEVLAFLRSL